MRSISERPWGIAMRASQSTAPLDRVEGQHLAVGETGVDDAVAQDRRTGAADREDRHVAVEAPQRARRFA
jgi:hypothetical protein